MRTTHKVHATITAAAGPQSEWSKYDHEVLNHARGADDEIARLRAPLLAWRKTPGNKRDATWWSEWHASVDLALGNSEQTEDRTDA